MERKQRGDRIGHFTVREAIPHGAQANSYICARPDSSLVFVKVYEPLHDNDTKERFFREIETIARLSDPHLPRYLESDVTAEFPWLAMEFVAGESLEQHVQRAGPLSVVNAARLGCEIASALVVLHRQRLVHRDVKPQNIMLSHATSKLVDLGIVGGGDFAAMTQLGFQPGTPRFMSPEQEEGRRLTAASDIYSLAVTLLYAIGEFPGASRDDRSVATSKRPFISVLWDVLRAVPGERPDASTLIDRLAHLVEPESDPRQGQGAQSAIANTSVWIAPESERRDPGGMRLGWCITAGHCHECPSRVHFSTGAIAEVICAHECHWS